MRFFFCDPGLLGDVGHHAQSSRAIVGELRRRGIETQVFGSRHVEPKLQEELSARPHFRGFTYHFTDGDPVCGWLAAFLETTRLTIEDLRTLDPAPGPEDVVFLHSGQAAQLRALVGWLRDAPDIQRALLEFGTDPGLDLQRTPTGLNAEIRDPRQDPRSVFLRLAANEMDESVLRRLQMTTFDPAASELYELLLRRPVATLPVPRRRITDPRSRAGRRPVTVAVLGHQRLEKGYHLVPAIFEGLLQLFPGSELRLLAHNGGVGESPAEQEALARLAARDSRLVVEEKTADETHWAQLLERSDLIVCPYESNRFAASYSAVACEAVANGIPLVVPAETTLARTASEFGGGVAFAQWTAESVLIATAQAIRDFDRLAALAEAGAERWAQQHGPARTVDAILALTSASPPAATSAGGRRSSP